MMLRSLMGSAKGDPYYASRALGLHFDGSNGSTTFTDNSPTPKTATVLGNAQISTAQSVFGGASGLFDGTGDYLSFPNHTNFNFGSGNFDMSGWVRFNAWPGNYGGGYASEIISKDNVVTREFQLWVTGPASTIDTLVFTGYSSNTTSINVTAAVSLSLNTWYHIKVVRSGNLVYLFSDGVLLNVGGTAFNMTIQTTTVPVLIGALQPTGTYKYYLNGHAEDILIYKGVALHTANFTPPAQPFSNY